MRSLNLIGNVFGMLKVLTEAESSITPKGRTKRRFLCQCSCGNQKIISMDSLQMGHSKSCGCTSYELVAKARTKHGFARSRIYKIWQGMLARCNKPNCNAYKNYGGRGIKVCEKWNTFEGFYEDMGPSYYDGGTIERKDVNGNYEQSNCKWIDKKDQSWNLRKNVKVKFNGQMLNLKELSELVDIPIKIIQQRISNQKWSVEKAISNHIRTRKLFSFNGEMLTLTEISNVTAIHLRTLTTRVVDKGWSIEKATSTPVRKQGGNIKYPFNGEMLHLTDIQALTGISKETLWARIFKLKWPLEDAFNTPTLKPTEFHLHKFR